MENNLAVLIDFENIAAGTEKEGLGRFDVEALMQRVKDKGRILVARSYADWGRFSRFKQALLSANVTMMELTSHGMQDKNRADIAMVVDALELAFTRAYIDTFVVVSGDSDFTPMVLKMRELNKRVIGCGTRKSTSRLLVQACDEFFFYDTIAQPKKTRRATPPKVAEVGAMTLDVAYDLLEQALEGMQREDPDPPLASIVKTAMLRKSPDFSETDLGFGSFARFLEAAQDAGVVKIIRDRKSGGYRVDALDDGAASPLGLEDDEEVSAAGAGWRDPYLPTGARRYLDPLAEAGFVTVAAPTRKALLEALVDAVAERRKRRRKTTIPFVAEDVQRALRRTHPDLPLATIRSTLEALMHAGLLMHRDGTAIRNVSAVFALDKHADQLNSSLAQFFLAHLVDGGVDVSDTGLLAELLLGDASRRREIEEALAWLVSRGDGGAEAEGALNALDLDDLLLAEPVPSAASHGEPAADTEVEATEEGDKPKKKRKRSRGKKKEDAEPGEPLGDATTEVFAVDEPSGEALDDLLRSDLDALLEPSPR